MVTLPETNSSPLKIDHWKKGDSYWKPPFLWGKLLVSGRVVFRVGTPQKTNMSPKKGLFQ